MLSLHVKFLHAVCVQSMKLTSNMQIRMLTQVLGIYSVKREFVILNTQDLLLTPDNLWAV